MGLGELVVLTTVVDLDIKQIKQKHSFEHPKHMFKQEGPRALDRSPRSWHIR